MTERELSASEAAEILAGGLTEEDMNDVMGLKHELSSNIRWGKVVEAAFGPLMESMEQIVFHGGKRFVRYNGTSEAKAPVDNLFDADRRLLESDDKSGLRRQYVMLLLTRKLLGALKTRVNQTLGDIPVLTEEQEFATMIALEERGALTDDVIDAEFDEEGEGMREEPMADIVARLSQGKQDWNCTHPRTRVRRVKCAEDGGIWLETYCRECRQVVKSSLVQETPAGKKTRYRKPKKAKKCKHQYVEWVPGEEGKAARCTKEGCPHTITAIVDLKKINWREAGLEQPGDDPSQDVIDVL